MGTGRAGRGVAPRTAVAVRAQVAARPARLSASPPPPMPDAVLQEQSPPWGRRHPHFTSAASRRRRHPASAAGSSGGGGSPEPPRPAPWRGRRGLPRPVPRAGAEGRGGRGRGPCAISPSVGAGWRGEGARQTGGAPRLPDAVSRLLRRVGHTHLAPRGRRRGTGGRLTPQHLERLRLQPLRKVFPSANSHSGTRLQHLGSRCAACLRERGWRDLRWPRQAAGP